MLKLTKEEKTKLDNYPKVELTKEEFNKLPKYSLSIPTQSDSLGVKRWKKKTPFNASDKDAIWFLGEIKEDMNVFHHIVIVDDKTEPLVSTKPEALIIQRVSKSFTAEEVGDMLANKFSTIEEAIHYFDTVQ